jgi:uncharacterized FlgJ-related protein
MEPDKELEKQRKQRVELTNIKNTSSSAKKLNAVHSITEGKTSSIVTLPPIVRPKP